MAEHQLPLAWYDVMVQLVEAPERRLRMTDLAGAVLISRSGLTRLVDRMVADGLIRRAPAPDDARGTFACLTDEGYDRLRTATTTHLQGVAGYVIDRMERQGLVRREPHPTDRRAKIVRLTADGQSCRRNVLDALSHEAPINALTNDEQDALAALLRKATT